MFGFRQFLAVPSSSVCCDVYFILTICDRTMLWYLGFSSLATRKRKLQQEGEDEEESGVKQSRLADCEEIQPLVEVVCSPAFNDISTDNNKNRDNNENKEKSENCENKKNNDIKENLENDLDSWNIKMTENIKDYLDFPFLTDKLSTSYLEESLTLIIMRGLPGSGKSTIVSAIQQRWWKL